MESDWGYLRRIIVVFLCAFVMYSGSLQAQTVGSSATISGSVIDPDGRIVPAAAVSLKNDVTGETRMVQTVALGRFLLPALPVGIYTLEVTAPGFAKARSANLQLTANG